MPFGLNTRLALDAVTSSLPFVSRSPPREGVESSTTANEASTHTLPLYLRYSPAAAAVIVTSVNPASELDDAALLIQFVPL